MRDGIFTHDAHVDIPLKTEMSPLLLLLLLLLKQGLRFKSSERRKIYSMRDLLPSKPTRLR